MQAQAMLFPLSEAEFKDKAKELSALELEEKRVLEEKDTTSREYNERLKKIRGQILRLAKEIDEEHAEREPTEDEAPWAGLVDRAERQVKRRRDRTGEYPDATGEEP
jgi:hypothetical protein